MAALLPKLAVARGSGFESSSPQAPGAPLLWFVPPLMAGALLAGTVVSAVAGLSFFMPRLHLLRFFLPAPSRYRPQHSAMRSWQNVKRAGSYESG